MKSSLKNMVVVLFSITLIASLCVGLVNKITFEPIEKAKAENIQKALKNVLPEFDASEEKAMTVDELPVIVHTAKQGEQVVGYAVETMTTKGFSGVFRLMVGFRASGEVYNINVLEHSETPGLGSKMGDEGNSLLVSFKDKNPANMKQPLAVTKDGGDVQALTAATISSRAYVDAVVLICEADFIELSKEFTSQKERLEAQVLECQKQIAEIEVKIAVGDNRRELIEKYVKVEHLTREMVEILIDKIMVGKRISGTRNVPIEIHWNF